MNLPLNLTPRRTVVTSFVGQGGSSSTADDNAIYDDGLYVLHVSSGQASSSGSGAAPFSCSLSDNSIHTYDRETLRLVHSITNAHVGGAITDLCHTSSLGNNGSGDNMVVSSGMDGFVRIFDLRQNSSNPAVQMQLPKKEQALSVSLGYGGTLAAVGSSKSQIHFFDLRGVSTGAAAAGSNCNVLGSYVDAHTDEVTKVRFQLSNDGLTPTSLLVSASEDGLACIHDTSQSSEEDALKSVLNCQSPLREVGFFGPSGEGLYCLTGSETMSVWHHDSAQRICDFGDARANLGASAGIPIDFLVGCNWNGSDLHLMAGNNEGDAALFRVDAGTISLSHKMTGGHKGCIRATTWPLQSSMTKSFITAGEDARLCEWSLNESPTGCFFPSKSNHSKIKSRKATKGGGPARRQKDKKKSSNMASPY